MPERITIAYNAVNAKLVDADRSAMLLVSKLLSYEVEGADQTTAFKSGHWDGRSSFFEMRLARFPAGFVHLVSQQLTKRGYEVSVLRKPLPTPNGPERPLFDPFGYTNPDYGYQAEVSDKLVRHGRLIAQIATGGGKSRVAQIVTARIMRPTLFLTTRSVLMYQMKEHYESMLRGLTTHHDMADAGKHTVGVLGDSVWDPRKFINVGMVQTLIARLKDPDPFQPEEKQAEQARIKAHTIRLLEMFELVILEEAHEASGNSYYDILSHCKNAHYRLALTATPFMKESGEANMRLMAVSGPIGIRVSEKQLIDSGILAKPYFKYLDIPERPAGLLKRTRWPNCYTIGVVENAARNAAIIKEAVRAVVYKLPIMILVQRKDHGKTLETALRQNGITSKFIFGDSDQATRKAALMALSKGEIQVLIGSTILDVGVDVPAIGMVILAGAGKAEVQLRQRIGRGLRAKKSGPNIALIVDFSDLGNQYLTQHALQRRQIIQDTPGFSENILTEGQDFDFKGLGLDV